MVQIDSSSRTSASTFTALSISFSVLKFAGLNISKFARLWTYGVAYVEFPDALAIGAKER